ncbi:MAG: tRNA 5-methoxyuridine(34)/uridine 5-oxyacetic acid(34) synthase CmoB [endosymbiont of Galathealinum brachiosum]|uniref:tRNA U34 carboxymethyltransferase n=1 Tax=endosymbiont of Galathealinum brachiosum TaxID=2200906 RepID=A0A370DCP3_9GAMM|nr:MAG: tRNA 5-methoxyuridine(34)/uridine 5-oxyacetic acid(34) synthase CmoB [endosymbiont of Galathealinum brachiosum]
MNFERLFELLQGTELEPWLETLDEKIQKGLCNDTYGNLAGWKKALKTLPEINAHRVDLNATQITVSAEPPLSESEKEDLKEKFKQLIPWRKGPYLLHGVDVDTEWRSDLKWQRLSSAIKPLEGRTILDVGCGNGYHAWRMRGMGAELVIGIDPSPLFVMQFQAVQHFINDEHVYVLPLGIEAVPDDLKAFDTVFSMGVFYHRKSPIDHLYQLRQCLKPGGELVLETLVIPGDEFQVLMPEDRYAQMRNVWFLPSSKAMIKWLQRCGFKNVKLVDESITGLEEQRSTEWMLFHSLKDFLDPQDSSKTVEGYPAPLRAIFTADAP